MSARTSSVSRGADLGLRRARTIARVFDDAYLDPILGFVLPGLGDMVSSAFGLYIVGIALDRGLPPVVIARMVINLALDATIGAIPIVGDLFDIAFKANRRNLDLLERRHRYRRAEPGDWMFVAGAALATGLAVLVPIAIFVGLIRWIF